MKIQYHHKGKSERVGPLWTESSHRERSRAIVNGVRPSPTELDHHERSQTIAD